MPMFVRLILSASLFTGPAMLAHADEPPLAQFFGFDPLEVVKIDRGAGPIKVADVNGDGLNDLIVVNNFASRIEIHYQKKNASPDDEISQPTRANQLPEHWRFRRELISVTHRVQAVVPYDFDGDGLVDLIYAGIPSEIVFLRQTSPGAFQIARRHSVRNLSANRDGLHVADLIGDERPELISMAAGKINIWPMNGSNLGTPIELAAGAPMAAISVHDFNGDGRLDIAGIIPDDPAPVRLWLGSSEGGRSKIGPQVRFEMPALREFEAVYLPGEPAARIAVIERASRRIVLYELAQEPIEASGDRDAALSVFSFTDANNRKRDTKVFDIDGDGLLDFVATDTEANALVVYRQVQDKGLQPGVSYPTLSDLDSIAAGTISETGQAAVFVLSQKEGVVGRSDAGADGIAFPKPLNIPDGNTPVAMNLVQLEGPPPSGGGQKVAVVAKSGRDYVLYLIRMNGERETISLGSASRSPDSIVALDADQDGHTDLLLFTRDKPMTMIRATDDGFKVLESKDMGQFGLVQAANSLNTAIMDIDGNGKPELLIADKNYVRAVRYETDPAPGVSPGWQVVKQINANDSNAKLISVALIGAGAQARVVAADKDNGRLVVFGVRAAASESQAPGGPEWGQIETLRVRGFTIGAIYAGAFSGDGQQDILAVGDDGFAVIRLGGERLSLKQFAAWRTDQERRLQHELASGDINSDGFTDLVSLDAGEQMCEIFTFTESHRMLYATGFKVYESKLFTSGEPREYQPSEVHIADITGDGANDLILLSQDRVLIFPQMKPTTTPRADKQ